MNVKRKILFLLAVGIIAGTVPARAGHSIGVIGLVNLTNYAAGLLVITDSPPDAPVSTSTHRWVTGNQSFDDLNLLNNRLHVEITQVDCANGVVRAKENGIDTFYLPQQTNLLAGFAAPGFRLNNVGFDDALDFYAVAKGRTLLVHPDVKGPLLTVSADVRTRAEAAGIMEKTLKGKGVAIIADGRSFEWIVPAEATNLVPPAALPPRLPPKGSPPANAADTTPAGSINFSNVDLAQILDVYKALTDQKWVQEKPLPSGGTYTFHNQAPLTKYEILHAFDVLLAWNGLKIITSNDKSFEVVPFAAGR